MSKRSKRRQRHKAHPLDWIKRAGTSPPPLPSAVDAELAAKSPALAFAKHLLVHDAEPFVPMVMPSSPIDHNRTHSLGRRSYSHIADQLLHAATAPAEPPRKVDPTDDRPLIDRLHDATFRDDLSMQYVKDKYALRGLLRKAHCFTLDAATSALVADFSLAIVPDLDSARRLAIPPFPVTWFDIDNRARLARIKAHGVRLTSTAEREDVLERVGWLIHPAKDLHEDGYYATYCAEFDQGVFVAPLSFFWSPHEGRAIEEFGQDDERRLMDRIMFGVERHNVSHLDAFPATTPFNLDHASLSAGDRRAIIEMMTEISGEARHVWGVLIALGAGQLHGAAGTMKPQPKPSRPPFEQKGKTLHPIEHKVLTITLSKRTTPEKVVLRAITQAKKRWHEVRAHWRTKLNPDGTVKWRTPIKAHTRGDERLGRIEKTYKVQK